jgi:hypothetical protein
MFVAQWKKDYLEQMVIDHTQKKNAYGETLQEVIAGEVRSGFENRDEMCEVFADIADEFDVSTEDVWSIYYDGDY